MNKNTSRRMGRFSAHAVKLKGLYKASTERVGKFIIRIL